MQLFSLHLSKQKKVLWINLMMIQAITNYLKKSVKPLVKPSLNCINCIFKLKENLKNETGKHRLFLSRI